MRFLGWVPNISGRLSFFKLSSSHLTRSSDHTTIFSPGGESRFVVAKHERVTNDTPIKAIARALIPPPFVKLSLWVDWAPKDTFTYIAALRGDTSDNFLLGKVYILKPWKFSRSWRALFDEKYKQIRLSGRNGDGLDFLHCEQLSASLKDLYDSENVSHVVSASVYLNRDGRCYVDVPDDGRLRWPSESVRANYIFMFVKDLFHTHLHHADSDDALVPICDVQAGTRWAVETERSLYRSVLAARQGSQRRDLAEAEGRLAFLSSFRTMFPRNAPSRDLEQLRRSIKASMAQDEAKAEKNHLLVALSLLVPFAVFELFVHIAEAVEGHKVAHHDFIPDNFMKFLEYLYSFTTEKPWASAAIFTLLTLLYASKSGVFDIDRWRIVKAVTRSMTKAVRIYQGIPGAILTTLSVFLFGAGILTIITSQ